MNASVNYHVRKPVTQAFEFDADGIEGNLISPELVTTNVNVYDIRKSESNIGFKTHGITFLEGLDAVPYPFMADDEGQYNRQIAAMLRAKLGAKDVLVFDHTVRIDDENASRRPARNVHNDYSEKGIQNRLIDLVGEEKAAEYHNGHFGFVNLWRPVENTIMSSPLGFICPESMNIEDWIDIELVYPDRKGEILGVTANPEHRWFYKSKMRVDEGIIFNIFDNKGIPHLAHSALDMSEEGAKNATRKSIESRMLVKY
ncbi:CmcJ/NvfI family oxidoreductase [Aestuariibacter sp. A3R04]|uniref:CmcJ/NvfI family oxidoreductase n=1 Tax=Aestuariibacter sp. A3R04 TaxID=2841571 RepID=UPI001C0A29B7|nr:CmcJ/NvfI family oxidoreductase [Aestuariibacter sp. A3R04]MBU3021637.1 hypothetical protein [Aestuariibacter sp. A3R04]